MRSTPIKWWGGKAYLAKRIVALMPRHLHYVEPFAGGLSVLLAKDPAGVSEVANDLHGWLTAFWHVMANPILFEAFRRHVEGMPFAEKLWDESGEPIAADPDLVRRDPVAAATAFFVRCRQSRAGQMKEFATLSRTRTRAGMNEQASAWLSAVDGLPAVHARLRRVVILNRDALAVIRQQDGPDTLTYCDPPYVPESRTSTGQYRHEMTGEQHVDLCTTVRKCVGKVMVSGYPSDLYKFQLEDAGWHRTEFVVPNQAAGGDVKRRMTEVVWSNFVPATGA